jgi:transcriptional regulator with XRE-family HTH domain
MLSVMRTPRTVLGHRLRAARIARGLTQAQLAARLGTRRSAISAVETGIITTPAATTLAALAQALDITVSWLLSDDPDAPGGP